MGLTGGGLFMKKENPFSLFADSDCELTENPLWNKTDRMLYWKGWTPGTIYRKAPGTPAASFERFLLPVGQIGGFAFMPDGTLLMFAQHGRVWSWIPGKSPVKLAELPGAGDKTFFNDLIADPEGRIFIGMLARDYFSNLKNPHAKWTSGSLWRFDPDCSFHCLEPSTGNTPNGMGFSLDRTWFYFAVTDENTVYRYHYDSATGRISNRTALIQSPACDGMTVDSEGCLWIAQAGGNPLARYSPDGALLAEEHLPVKGLTSITFGGDDLKTIFVTTAKSPGDANPSSGGVFLKQQDIRGVPEFPAATISIKE